MIDMNTLWLILFIVSCANFFFSLIRTYYNWRTLSESRQYWNSWKERQTDIARKVIENLSDEEIRKLAEKIKAIKGDVN